MAKYRAKKAMCAQGHRHDSIMESRQCDELHIRQDRGEIRNLKVHPTFYFNLNGRQIKHGNGRRVSYTPDWSYSEGNHSVIHECKGFRTSDYVLRLAFFKAFFPYYDFRETGRRK